MDEKPILSQEELNILLGGDNPEGSMSGLGADKTDDERDHTAIPPAHVLVNALRALVSRVEILEQQVRELRKEAAVRQVQTVVQADSPNKPEQASVEERTVRDRQEDGQRLSRLEKYRRSSLRR